jgi:hypothetical protein
VQYDDYNRQEKEENMATIRTVLYECDVCGTEVIVNSAGIERVSPIYCCGIELTERTLSPAKKTAPAKDRETKTLKKAGVSAGINKKSEISARAAHPKASPKKSAKTSAKSRRKS